MCGAHHAEGGEPHGAYCTQRVAPGGGRVSLDPILWAMKDAPVKDAEEWAVLVCMAEHADEDGCNAFPSQATIAERTKLHVRTVARRVAELEARGLITPGNQAIVAERAVRS